MKNRLFPILFSSVLIVAAFTLLSSSSTFADMSVRPMRSDKIGPIGQVLHDNHDIAPAAPPL